MAGPNFLLGEEEILATDETRKKHGSVKSFVKSVFIPCFIRGFYFFRPQDFLCTFAFRCSLSKSRLHKPPRVLIIRGKSLARFEFWRKQPLRDSVANDVDSFDTSGWRVVPAVSFAGTRRSRRARSRL
jgi:hypothetical protein